MEPIELALRKDFLSTLFGGEEGDDDLRELLGHGVKRSGVVITDPRNSAEQGQMMSVEACEALVESLSGGTELNYTGNRSCVQKAITRTRKIR